MERIIDGITPLFSCQIYALSRLAVGRRKVGVRLTATPEPEGDGRQVRGRVSCSSPASRAKKEGHPTGCPSFFVCRGCRRSRLFPGPPQKRRLLWGKEPQRRECIFLPAGKQGIRSLRRRSPASRTKETSERVSLFCSVQPCQNGENPCSSCFQEEQGLFS